MLTGKVAIVTGAARGIGREFAITLAKAGAKVIAADVSDSAETVSLAGGNAAAVTCDVASMASAQAMADAALSRFGRIDVLVNNAALYGSLKTGRFDKIDEAEWDATMRVNVKGIWNCCKAAVPGMRKAGGGSIINISSLAATRGAAFALHYTVSKAAVIGITRGLARELGRDNIRVNSIAPSAVLTEGTQQFFGEKHERALQAIAADQSIQRNLHPADVAGAMLWLASPQSSFVTGQTISVDGGTVML
ncbi:MAG TPA: glucose 1-dehydrogenase [Candidatus Sulfotelmatobacter sp.]|nr:glucose 1-dehydrogenase [Candidatus Sulfotelmatobacter sp.]